MHKTPNGEEGYKYTAEEVYDMVGTLVAKSRTQSKLNQRNSNSQIGGSCTDDSEGVGKGKGSDSKEGGSSPTGKGGGRDSKEGGS